MNIGIWAMDGHNGIGYNNSIPWHNKDDFVHFKTTTDNQIVIMGRKTLDSLRPFFKGEILPNRTKLVVSTRDYCQNECCYSCSEIFNFVKDHSSKTFYVIGGKTIYDLFNQHNLLDELIITVIDGIYQCDTFMDVVLENNELQYHHNMFILKNVKQINNGNIYYFTRSSK